jgi:undecaprenyl-diphosphatase
LPHLKPILASKTVVTKDVILEFNNKTLPKFTEKLSGASQQPLSFLIVAKDNQEFLKLFTNEGWTQTERLTFTGIFNLAEAAFTNKSYPQGFITPTFWENKVQDFSFAKLTSQNTVRIRHHCRFWTTNIKTPNARNLYVGYCSFDKGIKPWLITHEIDPNLDKERDYLLNDILKTKEVKSFTKFNFVNPIQGRTFQGDYFYTDGRVYLIDLN